MSKFLTIGVHRAKKETSHKSLSVGVATRTESYIFVSLAVVVSLFSQQKVTFSTCLLPSYCYSEHGRRRCLGCFALWKMAPVSASDTATTSWLSGALPVASLSDIWKRLGSQLSGRFLIKPIKQMREGGMTNDMRFIRLRCHTEANFARCLFVS